MKLSEFAKECRDTWKEDRSGVPVVGLEHLEPGEVKLSAWDVDSENTFTKRFNKGQVLLGRRRVYLRKAVVAPFDGICSGDITVIEAIPGKILPELLPFVIQNDAFFDYAEQGSAGSLSPRVKWEHLKDFEVNLPSIDDQKALAEKLWAAYRLKESYKKLLAATDEMVKSRFIEMFGDGDWSKCQWPTSKMEDVFEISSSKRILKDQWTCVGVPFLRVRDLVALSSGEPLNNEFCVSQAFYDSLKDEDGKVSPGDIMVSATSTIGLCYEVKDGECFYYKDADVLRFRKKTPINSAYFMYALLMPTIYNQILGTIGITTVGHFLISKAKTIRLPLPPLELQDEFERILKQADKSGFELRKSIENIDAVIKSLINN